MRVCKEEEEEDPGVERGIAVEGRRSCMREDANRGRAGRWQFVHFIVGGTEARRTRWTREAATACVHSTEYTRVQLRKSFHCFSQCALFTIAPNSTVHKQVRWWGHETGGWREISVVCGVCGQVNVAACRGAEQKKQRGRHALAPTSRQPRRPSFHGNDAPPGPRTQHTPPKK